jgi:spore coat protein JC
MIYKLTKDANPEQMRAAGLGYCYVSHDRALFYQKAAGIPVTLSYFQAKGDHIDDLYEDIAAEEKARATCRWVFAMTDDVDLQDGLNFYVSVKLSIL